MNKNESYKRDYIKKIFARTNKKDYENYVLSGIWHKLDNLNLKPVTQQYIKCRGDKYYLMDMYFPQINFAVEVNEGYHKRQLSQDNLRMDDILQAIEDDNFIDSSINSKILFFKVDVTTNLEAINSKINEVVKNIRDRIKDFEDQGIKIEWLSPEEEYKKVKETHDKIFVEDYITFKTIKDVLNTIFGNDYLNYMKSYSFFDIGERDDGIDMFSAPKLSIKNSNGEFISLAAGWINELSMDWNELIESKDNYSVLPYVTKGFKRAIFAKYKNNLGISGYRFLGVYKLTDNSDPTKRIYTRVSKELKIIK